MTLSRRQMLQISTLTAAATLTPGSLAAAAEGRLSSRHHQPGTAIIPGEHVLDDINGRRAILYVPPSYKAANPAPFMMMLHGARGDGDGTLASQRAAAEEHGVVLLCPSTRSGTWDAIRGSFSHDFEKIDALLTQVFDRCNIDPTRVASAGFSDGASYALTLGLLNGDFFTHIIAHSPGFIIADNWQGMPAVYLSHGHEDQVLPFDRCGAVIAARLDRAGYSPRFDVFDGGHTASPELRSAALGWFAG
jgi:phospholipase/carboxylesterase